jgi:uncharacterized delta-60 repeat protein
MKSKITLLASVIMLVANFAVPTFSIAQVTQEWASRYNGPGSGADYARSLAVDGSGNMYVTGYSTEYGTNSDYTTIKYNSTGDTLWIARYNGPANGRDQAYALAVDGSGNVYVTGRSVGSGLYSDYTTIKYNSTGVEQWVARYDGGANGNDAAQSLAVDGSGNVYVTGQSFVGGGRSPSDYATIKYDSTGVEQWVARYDGGANGIDAATSLVVDGSGNVYVTGRSPGIGTSYDYATIKYDSAGDTLWTARYNGPGNGVDAASSLAVDSSGNVYVTGRSPGIGTSDDYATIKYSSTGDTLWTARYNGTGNSIDAASSLAVDGSGNVYVTGGSVGSGTGGDYATIQYDSTGVEQWAARYNGPGTSDDGASSLAVDGSGNVYVTGKSPGSGTDNDYATIKYNSTGVEQWAARYNGPANGIDAASSLAVDDSGNVYVTGESVGIGTLSDCGTIKYDSTGVALWVTRYDETGMAHDNATSLAVDGSGNVYVTGRSWGGETSYDYATIKYNSTGARQWVARYNGPGNDLDEPTSIAVDGLGNVYVTGTSPGSGTANDYATIKYDSSGVQQWAARYNGPENGGDAAQSLAVDGSGNVYVTGASIGSGGSYPDYATIKYNSSGVEKWARRYNGPLNRLDYARSVAVDGSGNVYVTGASEGINTGYYDYATIKYHSSGAQLWVARYNGPGNGYDFAWSLALDGLGNVYVTGQSAGSQTEGYDYATIKYNSSGAEQWAARYNGPGSGWDAAYSLAVDGSGNVYVTGSSPRTGTSNGPGKDHDYATIKYDSTGVEQWAERYKGPGTGDDIARSVAVDGSGNVYVTGTSQGSGTANDYVTIKYNSTGVEQWAERYNGPGSAGDGASSLAVDGSGNVYVTGESFISSTNNDYTTIKYSQQTVGFETIPAKISLLQLFPNPATSSVTIKFHADEAGEIQIVNLFGQIVYSEKVNAEQTQIDVSRFAAGMYVISWSSGEQFETKTFSVTK